MMNIMPKKKTRKDGGEVPKQAPGRLCRAVPLAICESDDGAGDTYDDHGHRPDGQVVPKKQDTCQCRPHRVEAEKKQRIHRGGVHECQVQSNSHQANVTSASHGVATSLLQ